MSSARNKVSAICSPRPCSSAQMPARAAISACVWNRSGTCLRTRRTRCPNEGRDNRNRSECAEHPAPPRLDRRGLILSDDGRTSRENRGEIGGHAVRAERVANETLRHDQEPPHRDRHVPTDRKQSSQPWI